MRTLPDFDRSVTVASDVERDGFSYYCSTRWIVTRTDGQTWADFVAVEIDDEPPGGIELTDAEFYAAYARAIRRAILDA